MSTKFMLSSLVIAALLTGGLYGFVLQAAAATGEACVAGEIVHLTAQQGAEILELHIEIDDDPADALIPRTMHPAIPAYAIINVTHAPESPVGAFTMGEVRIAGRTGVRPRGFVLRSFCDSEAARKELSSRWGFPIAAGDVSLVLRHDRVAGKVLSA